MRRLKRPLDLTGIRFGELTVTGPACRPDEDYPARIYYPCSCSCGFPYIVRRDHLLSGEATRCKWCKYHRAFETMRLRSRPQAVA